MADLTSLGDLRGFVQAEEQGQCEIQNEKKQLEWQKTKDLDPKDSIVRAESLASGKFRREKFWPKRHRCERGIIEVLDDIQFQYKMTDDFPDRQSDFSVISEDESIEEKSKYSYFVSEDSQFLNANLLQSNRAVIVPEGYPLPLLMQFEEKKPVYDKRHRQVYRVIIPKREQKRRLKALQRQPPRIMHRVQSRQIFTPYGMLPDQKSTYTVSSDSDSGRDLFTEMLQTIFKREKTNYDDCDEICERCYDRCKGLCLLQQHSDDHIQRNQYFTGLCGSGAISIDECSQSHDSTRELLKSEIADLFANLKPKKDSQKSARVAETLMGQSHQLIEDRNRPKKTQSISELTSESESERGLNFLTPIAFDRLIVDRFLDEIPVKRT